MVTGSLLRLAIEHTLLSPAATPAMIDALCDEAIAHGFGGVCVHPVYVARCARRLAASDVRVVSVVGFPSGATYSRCKALEAELAVADGADELDMVMQIGAAKAGDWQAVEADARAVVDSARDRAVKLILETGLLSDEEKRRACAAALGAHIGFVKTCTGFAQGAASREDVALLAAALDGRVGIKASGGIRTLAQARALLAAGASRLGTSAGTQIAAELEAEVQ
jgi:deoxyribose-phosphate aldolase